MNTHEFYVQLHGSAGDVISQSFASTHGPAISEAHSYAADLADWTKLLGGRKESSLLLGAARDLQHASLVTSMGMYRAGFSALRLFFEKTLGAIYLSANEMALRLRLSGLRDQSWSQIVDDDRGVFSKNFAKAFFPDLENFSQDYKALAKELYRTCSEFVHGNPSAEEALPTHVQFAEQTLEKWGGSFASARAVTSYALALRYLNDFTPEQLTEVSDMLDDISHLQPIRNMFKASNE